MAIKQYSRIQHRRGKIEDLPNPLNTSEIGHVLDERRLFIGNGSEVEGAPETGNTEIITEYSLIADVEALKHIYRSNTSVEAVTGTSGTTPTVRGVAQVLDDRLSIKSFGAVGDGETDDTDAINRCLENIYTVAISGAEVASGYRAVYFPAGTYFITDRGYFPPNSILIGDGIGRTKIVMGESTIGSVFSTADSDFQTDLEIGTNGASLPTNIFVYGIEFEHSGDLDVIQLERCNNVEFVKCKFKNAYDTGTVSSSASIKIDALGSSVDIFDIRFRGCEFEGGGYIINLDSNSNSAGNISFEDCKFKNFYRGGYVNSDNQTVKFINGRFDTITQKVIYAGPESVAVTSINNTFIDCGGPSHANIEFATDGTNRATKCQSIGDEFINPGGQRIVDNGNNSTILNNEVGLHFGGSKTGPKSGPLTLNGTTTNGLTGISFDITSNDVAFVDYALTIPDGTNLAVRTGTLHIVCGDTLADTLTLTGETVLGDVSTESSPTGVSFDTNLSGTNLRITYTSSSSETARMVYQIKTWSLT